MKTSTNPVNMITPTKTGKPSGRADAELRGMAMVLLATVGWSFAGLFTRALTIDVATTAVWRSLASGLLLLAVWLVQRRAAFIDDLTNLGRPDWIAVLASTVAQAASTTSLFFTSVAHVAVIYALTPFVAALIAWWCLGQRVAGSTLVAVLVSTGGIAVVVAGSLGAGSFLGDTLALVMTLAFAVLIVLPKAFPDLRVAESMCMGSFITCALFLPFSHTAGLDPRNLALVSAYGSINLVVGYHLFIQGARHIPAASAGLIATLEIVLSPLWVWLFLDEKVGASTVVGGAVVFGAVVGNILASMRQAPSADIVAAG